MNIRERREKLHLSQGDVAKTLKVARTTYANYENGHCEPNIEVLIKLADFFNISIDELVGRPTDMINLNLLDDTRKNLIKEILTASDTAVGRLDAFYQGIKLAEKEREEIINRMRGKHDN